MIPVMTRKENALSISTVSTLAVALLLGRLLLHSELAPPSIGSVRAVVGLPEVLHDFEVPTTDAGRRFERQQSADSMASLGPGGSPIGGSAQEVSRTSRSAQTQQGSGDTLVAAVLAFWVLLGVWVLLSDKREMELELEEEEELKKEPPLSDTVTPPSSPADMQLLHGKVLCYPLAVAGVSAAGLAAMVWLTRSQLQLFATIGASVAEAARAAATAVAGSVRSAPSDKATAIVLSISAVLGLAAAHVDVQDEADRCEDESSNLHAQVQN
jgi:hypothetical protein